MRVEVIDRVDSVRKKMEVMRVYVDCRVVLCEGNHNGAVF